MQIEILESFLDGRNRYEQGETRVVSESDGAFFCSAGWARDLAGVVETAPRQETGEVRLDIRNVTQEQGVETNG